MVVPLLWLFKDLQNLVGNEEFPYWRTPKKSRAFPILQKHPTWLFIISLEIFELFIVILHFKVDARGGVGIGLCFRRNGVRLNF